MKRRVEFVVHNEFVAYADSRMLEFDRTRRFVDGNDIVEQSIPVEIRMTQDIELRRPVLDIEVIE